MPNCMPRLMWMPSAGPPNSVGLWRMCRNAPRRIGRVDWDRLFHRGFPMVPAYPSNGSPEAVAIQ